MFYWLKLNYIQNNCPGLDTSLVALKTSMQETFCCPRTVCFRVQTAVIIFQPIKFKKKHTHIATITTITSVTINHVLVTIANNTLGLINPWAHTCACQTMLHTFIGGTWKCQTIRKTTMNADAFRWCRNISTQQISQQISNIGRNHTWIARMQFTQRINHDSDRFDSHLCNRTPIGPTDPSFEFRVDTRLHVRQRANTSPH